MINFKQSKKRKQISNNKNLNLLSDSFFAAFLLWCGLSYFPLTTCNTVQSFIQLQILSGVLWLVADDIIPIQNFVFTISSVNFARILKKQLISCYKFLYWIR